MHFLRLFVRQQYDEIFCEYAHKHLDNYTYRLSPIRTNRGIWKLLFTLYTLNIFNKHIHLPAKLWYNRVFDKDARALMKNENVCIIASCFKDIFFLIPCIEMAKKRNPNVKAVCIFEDTVKYYQGGNNFSMDYLKKVFDIIYSYNNFDARHYQLKRLCAHIKEFDIEDTSNLPETDLFFVGQEKGRLKELIDIYEKCTAYGLKCDFYVNGVSPDKQVYPEFIKYNQPLDYRDVIRHCYKTKCIVNLVQEGVEGITLRDNEAIGMNKLLLTNSTAIFKSYVYTPDKVIPLNELDGNLQKIKEGPSSKPWNYKENHSVYQYYKSIENDLAENAK